MEQVPKKIYGLVGSGRLATHLAHYFRALDIPLKTWSRREEIPVEHALAECDTVLLAISDDALRSFVELHPQLKTKTIVHFSGALVIPGLAGAHPLMSFGPDLYDDRTYAEIPFVTEAGQASFRELFPRLANPSVAIEAKKKPLYHALCVMSGNFTVLLWNKFFRELETLGLEKNLALPYMKRIFSNLEATESNALTGPIARKDRLTLQTDIQALVGDPYQEIFKSFVQAELPQ